MRPKANVGYWSIKKKYSSGVSAFRINRETMAKNSGERILVADDDTTSRKLLTRILTRAGFACDEAPDGIEALRQLHEEPPSLLLLDYDMPGMNGAEVLKQLRHDGSATIAQIPTIMLTGHGGEESEVLCLEAGADDFVTKPINDAVLRARIDTQLRLRSMRNQLQKQNDELEAWRHNLERDLAAARLTQQSLIPQKPPVLPGWEIAACYRPVIQVGGDIYGWLRMADGRTLFWIADATGHGASAALLTTLAKLLFHHGTAENDEPAKIMENVNNDFRSIFGARSFMTAMCVALDSATGRASVVGAGHPPLLVARAGGRTESLASSAPPLGLLERSEFIETNVDLEPGDALLLYTDGIYGAGHGENPMLSAKRLAESLQPMAESAQALLDRALEQAGIQNNGNEPPDDVAVIAVRRSH
jgi:sigma-B regulation protein RsbU (phosphoserine phosphatase)